MAVRAVRNFWLDVDIDGRKTNLEDGPKSRFGGFYARIKQRDRGSITCPVEIEGIEDDGELTIKIYIEGALVGEHKTQR